LEQLEADKPAAISITYNILLFSTEELKRAPTRRQPIASYLVLKNDIPWEDFYAQLKLKACDALFPNEPLVNNDSFTMTFSVPRHVSNPLNLISTADYAHLLANASKIKTNPTAKIMIHSCAPNLVGVRFEFPMMHTQCIYRNQAKKIC